MGRGWRFTKCPRLAAGQKTKLRPGMIVTVEPGIYLPGWGGVRIEDDILVTRDGHEVLTDVPKQLDDCVPWRIGLSERVPADVSRPRQRATTRAESEH